MYKKITIIFLLLLLIFTSPIIAKDSNMQKLLELEKKVKKAEENYEMGKVKSLKEEAVNYVDDIETAKKFKEIFPDIKYYDKVATKLVEKLVKLLNREDLFTLVELFPDNMSIEDAKNKILKKSNSLESIEELFNRLSKVNYVEYDARQKAVKYVDDLESAEKFKEIFPDLDRYNKQATKIYDKLKNRLNREELIKLNKTFANQDFSGIKDLILNKSKNIEDIVDTTEEFPDLKRYYPSKIEKLAYKFVKDKESARQFLDKFPESDEKYREGAQKYINNSSEQSEKMNNEEQIETNNKKENKEKNEKNTKEKKETKDQEKESQNKIEYKNTKGYKKLLEVEEKIKEGETTVSSVKEESLEYIDGVSSAKKYKEIFYSSIDNRDAFDIIKKLKDKLNRKEMYQLTIIFAEFPSVRDAIFSYIDKSNNLDEVIKASNEFADHKYQGRCEEMGLEFVNDLSTAIKYKNKFYKNTELNNSTAHGKIYEIVKSELSNSNNIDEAIKISKEFEDIYYIGSLGKDVINLVDSEEKLLKFVNYYPVDNYKIEDLLKQFNKDELLKVAKNFEKENIKDIARNVYFNKSNSYQDFKNVINYFPGYKTEAKNIVLNSIDNIEEAVKIKNTIPTLEDSVEKIAINKVNDLNSAIIYDQEFSVKNKKVSVIKKLMKTLSKEDLLNLLQEYNKTENKDKIIQLSKEYQNIKSEYDKISEKNPEFQLQGDIKDRTKDELYIRGEAYPVDAPPNTYGALLDRSNIYIVDYNQDGIKMDYYISQGHYLIKRDTGTGYFGQDVPVWIYGDKPEKLKNIESELMNIEEKINDLNI